MKEKYEKYKLAYNQTRLQEKKFKAELEQLKLDST